MTRADTDQLLREFRADVPPAEAAAVRRAREALERRAAGDAPARARRPRRRRTLAVTGAVAVAVAIGAVVGLDSGGVHRDLTAAQALERVARVAASQPAERTLVRPGQYWYVRSRTAFMTTEIRSRVSYSAITPSIREIWLGRSGGGRLNEHGSMPIFLGPRDKQRWVSAGRPDLRRDNVTSLGGSPAIVAFGSRSLTFTQLRRLPTGPAALYRRIKAAAGEAGPGPSQEAFTVIGDLLREAPVPPRIRAALYRAAGRIHGVRLVGEVRDPVGRTGLAIALTANDTRRELIFDPKTSALLAEREVLIHRVKWIDAPAGATIGSSTYLKSGVVDSTHDRP
jgi:hypothetical protein